ncbi:GH3 auxin-responsive promoter [Corchorus olitorius]|uniref:GH3 auxin-responsive promoter n=1 Tax=Corchorus olitorius TaxID=93759 RepID=A0A1R3IWV6_9ROSI|nr:GH3 auxin-responsive promoter [Corchorus olitorius]
MVVVSLYYASSEANFGINLKPLCKPSEVSYTFLPNAAYFEFLPLDKDSVRDKTHQQLEFDDTSPKLVDLVNVKRGQYYEVVVTTLAGLYQYRVGDVHKVTGFYNESPQFEFVERQNVVLSIDGEKTSEADISRAIKNAKHLLDSLGIVLTSYTSYSDTSSTPGRYVLFWGLKTKESNNDLPKLDRLRMEECCFILEESLDDIYKLLRNSNTIAPLEIRVVRQGTFDALMDFYASKGASIAQYKTPSCIKSEEARNILNSGVVASFFSPITIF